MNNPKEEALDSLQEQLVDLKMNPEWLKATDGQYSKADWWRFNAEETTMTLAEIYALIQKENQKARVDELAHTGIEKFAVVCACQARMVSKFGKNVLAKEQRLKELEEETTNG